MKQELIKKLEKSIDELENMVSITGNQSAKTILLKMNQIIDNNIIAFNNLSLNTEEPVEHITLFDPHNMDSVFLPKLSLDPKLVIEEIIFWIKEATTFEYIEYLNIPNRLSTFKDLFAYFHKIITCLNLIDSKIELKEPSGTISFDPENVQEWKTEIHRIKKEQVEIKKNLQAKGEEVEKINNILRDIIAGYNDMLDIANSGESKAQIKSKLKTLFPLLVAISSPIVTAPVVTMIEHKVENTFDKPQENTEEIYSSPTPKN